MLHSQFIPLGGNKMFAVQGRDIVVFHVDGDFTLLSRSPHEGVPPDKTTCVAA